MSKHLVLMREVICKYHPLFKRSKERAELALTRPEIFNVEKLVEESLSHLGSYDYVDADHADFSDGSDSKTATIDKNKKVGYITNVISSAGEYKAGALRCIIYNPFDMNLLYFFLPKRAWTPLVSVSQGKGRIMFYYSLNNNSISRFENYRVNSFKQLALAH